VKAARPVLNGGREETCRKVTRLAPTQRMMRDVSLRVGVSESPLPGVSCIPRFFKTLQVLVKKGDIV
jgi:hypothetical protein